MTITSPSHLLPADAALDAAIADSAAAGLPPISVTPNQGKLLQLLARMQGARTILELGTLGGYSTIWLARALAPGGRLVTLEAEPRYAEIAGRTSRAPAVQSRSSCGSDRRCRPCPSCTPRARVRST